MFSPLTKILMKIFAVGFYRAHSGMLIFLFGSVIVYCFFINTLGVVPTWAVAEWNLAITLAVVSNPFILLVFCLTGFGYAIKSLQFTAGQLTASNNEFLYYSSSSLNKLQQFKSWVIVQFNMLLPLWLYGFFASVIGFYYGYYVLPICLLAYLCVLTGIIAFIYLKIVNRMIEINKQTLFIRLIKNWHKPLFLLYSFYVFNKLKITYFITKIFSWVFILGMISLFSDQQNDTMIAAAVMLVLITAHSILIYNEYRFTETALYFSHNFPYAKTKLFLGFSVNYLILMLPEIVWFISSYTLIKAAGLIVFGLSILLLFRSLVYWFGLDIKRFLFGVFLLFNVFFLAILYQYIWYLPLVNLIMAYLIFVKNYSNNSLKH